MRTTWGQEEWQGVRFNEANARRVAEAEAERDSANLRRGIRYALLFSLPIWAIIILLVWLL